MSLCVTHGVITPCLTHKPFTDDAQKPLTCKGLCFTLADMTCTRKQQYGCAMQPSVVRAGHALPARVDDESIRLG